MPNHALLSASSSHRWLNCPPSARLCEGYDDKGSDFAAEGTNAHALCEFKLRTALGMEAKDPTEDLTWYNSEMEECANGYVSFVMELVEEAKKTCPDPVVLIEQRLDYSALIQKNPEWEYAGVFADYGISGTGTKKRDEFNRMLAECEAGNIDIILTKSIQRFARNTVDLLNTVRHLKDLSIEVRFEKENINSLSGDGELKFDGQKCATPTLTEDEIKELFLRAANQVIDQKEQFIAIYEQVLSRSLDTTALESELSDLEAEINIAAELIEECIKENAHVALDQAEYQKRYDGLVARFDKAKARHAEVTDLIAERTARRHQIETYLKELQSREPLTEFRETDWLAMVDYITVHSKNDIRVTFKDGTEIKA